MKTRIAKFKSLCSGFDVYLDHEPTIGEYKQLTGWAEVELEPIVEPAEIAEIDKAIEQEHKRHNRRIHDLKQLRNMWHPSDTEYDQSIAS